MDGKRLPWLISSQVWVALFGGAPAVTVIAFLNARRLNAHGRSYAILIIGGLGLLTLVTSHCAMVSGAIPSSIDLAVNAGVAIGAYLLFRRLQAEPQRRYLEQHGPGFASLSVPAIAAIVVCTLGTLAIKRSVMSALERAGTLHPQTLAEARREFATQLVRVKSAGEPVAVPPASIELVQYDADAGKLAAYVTASPADGKKHPAIVWITGGDSNTIGPIWDEAPEENDQTASAFREAGIVTMYPSLRGGNENPGSQEAFYGEVDDVLAAAAWLSERDYVNPSRIYLGGHSTGGTLVLLVAEISNRFRAVFSFGPVSDIRTYEFDDLPFDTTDRAEFELRAPVRWLPSVRSRMFVIEGADEPGNAGALEQMAWSSKNPLIDFHLVPRANHFSALAPATRLLAKKILEDVGPTTTISLLQSEVDSLMAP